MQKTLSAASVTLLLVAALAIGGCGGGDSSVQASTTTMGQELSDLKKAYDEGIISEKEYERSKEKILERYD